jgi:hypothetical protein
MPWGEGFPQQAAGHRRLRKDADLPLKRGDLSILDLIAEIGARTYRPGLARLDNAVVLIEKRRM